MEIMDNVKLNSYNLKKMKSLTKLHMKNARMHYQAKVKRNILTEQQRKWTKLSGSQLRYLHVLINKECSEMTVQLLKILYYNHMQHTTENLQILLFLALAQLPLWKFYG
jgi:hypothetical protein